MKVLSFEEFKQQILDGIKACPSNWRYGQKVFNVSEKMLWEMTNHERNIAREVQFLDRVDCFYDNDQVDNFLTHCYIKYYDNQKR